MKERTANRHAKIRQRFTSLYEGRRLRSDDVIRKLAEEFDLAESTIERIVFKNN